jgi:hypothetical protein
MSDIGMICDAISKLGIAGKEAFMVFMAVKIIYIGAVFAGVVIVVRLILSTIKEACLKNSLSAEITRIIGEADYEGGLSITDSQRSKLINLIVNNKKELK